ncbi:MAG: thiolase family protein [Candidatus Lokiarchaeota archaeon]|nr:thiolase family protein [Candidatus Lokiarchaeota archaeon]MBD3200870.1 thiolase family protein [Candidatus Lokiarchaeota archaeon]
MKKVAICGIAQTKYEEQKIDLTISELVFEVVKEIHNKLNISNDDIGCVISSSNDFNDGRTIANMAIQDAVGSVRKAESRVSGDGAFAYVYGAMRILSGEYDTVLIVSHTKCSEGDQYLINNSIFDPFFQRHLGLDQISAAGLMANMYMTKYGISEQQAAKVVVKNRKNAMLNPYAHLQQKVSLEDVLESPMLAFPLKELEFPPFSDGAVAMLIANEEKAKELADTPVWLEGYGSCTDAYYLGHRNMSDLVGLEGAAKEAYKMAGISDPVNQLDVAEVYDAFSTHELMSYEALGFCEKGQGGNFIDTGATELEGSIPVNPSGGVLSSNPTMANGLIRVAEIALQLMGKAEKRQIADANIGLANGMNGICSQGNCVLIFGGGK